MARRRLPNLKRRRYRREPKRRFYVVCEGKNTEPTYFNALRATLANALIEVNTVAGVGVPQTVASTAVALARDLGLNPESSKELSSFEEQDEVWAVFDRDDHPNFASAVSRCYHAGVGVGRSNPCFEIWLILHETDYDKPDDRKAVQSHLAKLRPEYDKKRGKVPDCADLVARVEAAEARAATQLKRRDDEGAPFGCPSTTVGRLTGAIRLAAEEAT